MEYRYGMRVRGYSIGCQPMNGLLDREDDDSGEYLDVLVYDRPLTEEETEHYSLELISEDNETETTSIINFTTKEEKDMAKKNVVVEENENMVAEEVMAEEEVMQEEEESNIEDDDAYAIDFDGLDFDLIALDKSSQPVACSTIAKNMKDGKFTFENTVQRTNVWKIEQKSLLIHSLITKMPIPAMYAKVVEGGVKDFLDGKQRATAIKEFFFNEFALKDCPPVLLRIDKDEAEEKGIDVEACEIDSKDRIILPVDINGYTYEELPAGLQDAFRTATINIYSYSNENGTELDDEQTADMFYRLNNGTPLTKIEITRVKAKCYSKIKEMASHELFTTALSKAQLNKYANEDIVMKSLVLLNVEYPSLDNKDVRPFIETTDIDDNTVENLNNIFDIILDAHTCIMSDADLATNIDERKLNIKIAKRIFVRTHMMTVVPIVQRALIDDKDGREMADFFKKFFGSKSATSISDAYNSNARDGGNHAPKVAVRLAELSKAYDEFFSETSENIA